MAGYDELLGKARELYPGVRIGRPVRSRGYWAMITALRALRLRYDVDMRGAAAVGSGPAILVGNHSNAMDPVMVVMSAWWRVSAFTKLEVFEHRGAVFFRIMGQIPLRRGNADSTAWAMEMSRYALSDGGKIGIYPEGTRGPDQTKLHRLHKRVLIPLVQANPHVPIHVVATRYERRPRRRTKVDVRISGPLPVDARTMTPDEVTTVIRDALLEVGGFEYVDRYARDVKAEMRAAVSGEGSAGRPTS
jgi:1-acyl-sn-glycerol-3-phosphate acyltransferase